MKTAHLFAGIGGMALAAKRVGWTPTFFAEVDPYALADWTKCYKSSMRSGMTRNGTVFPLPTLAPLTVATESGSLRIPKGADVGIGSPTRWPTPRAFDATSAALLPTQSRDRKHTSPTHEGLARAVQIWPTPTGQGELQQERALTYERGRPVNGGDPPSDGRGGDWWSVEPNVGRVAHGVPSRVDRLRCLGNSIVPQIPEMIFRAIQASL